MTKNKGQNSSFIHERDRDLLDAFARVVSESDTIHLRSAMKRLVLQPARRFYVSPVRAAAVITCLLQGKEPLSVCTPTKKKMYADILARVKEEKARRPHDSVRKIVNSVVLSPAPCFYLTPASAKIILWKARRRLRKEIIENRRQKDDSPKTGGA